MKSQKERNRGEKNIDFLIFTTMGLHGIYNLFGSRAAIHTCSIYMNAVAFQSSEDLSCQLY